MEIKKQQKQEKWDKWLIDSSHFTVFAQSSKWGDILGSEGQNIEKLLVLDGREVVAQAQVVYKKLFLGLKYAFCPKGPVIKDKDKEVEIINTLGKYLKDKKCVFVRMEPENNLESNDYKIIPSKDINPKSTLFLDLLKTEEEILKNMHHKTRYNIRLSDRKGIVIKQEKDLKKFFDLMQKTGQRDSFRLHNKKHYKEILKSDLSYEFNAYKDDKVIAVGVFIGFGDTFTYLYGASDYGNRNLMAPNLLQWEAIKFGKELGYKYYDFFGIAPLDENKKYNEKHQYAGVTRFKLGFGGEYKEDAGTADIILNNKKYLFYKFLRRMRRVF